MVSLRLSSLVMDSKLLCENSCTRKSAHAESGSLRSSNTVPVTGVECFPHALHRYRCSPVLAKPALVISPEPQIGQESLAYALKKSMSPGKLSCRNSYMLRWLLATSSCEGSSSSSGTSSHGVADGASRFLFIPLMVVVLAACVGGEAEDYHITRTPSPAQALLWAKRYVS